MGKKNKSKKKVKKVAKKARGTARQLTRYNALQRILADYGKENSIKWGKGEFARKASLLYGKTKDFDIRAVGQNIDVFYKDYVDKDAVKREFPTDFPWYSFLEEIKTPIFDDVVIGITFKDDFQQFAVTGLPEVVQAYWEDVCYRYFRAHYNNSPVAYFKIATDDAGQPQTDNKTFVNYVIVAGAWQPETQKTPSTTPLPTQPSASTDTEGLIRLEKEKQATLQKVIELTKQGWSKDEIFKLLGK